MNAALAHRGPDDSGTFVAPSVALGSRRLAILDLSPAGHQPMASPDGSLHLVYNGEVYNYRELRDELAGAGHVFRSGTDTEVVLAAYAEWGEACVRRFNGMWAFAIWDSRRERLFCSRDRFGVKPFYYRHERGRFVFASEPKAFRHVPGLVLSPDARVVRDYVERGLVDHTDSTFFAGIQRLPAAHSLVLDRGGVRLERYWELEERASSDDDPAGALRELFLDSVRLRLRADVELGTALSGGIDSSAIVCAISSLLDGGGEAQKTFTAYFDEPGLDERPYARAVVEQADVDPHWLTFSGRELVDSLEAIVEGQDEPFSSTSMVAQWFVQREAARAGVRVMLDGQGGDEVFAGYPTYMGFFLADLLRAGRVGTLTTEVQDWRRLQGVGAGAIAGALARPFLPPTLKWRLRGRASGGTSLLSTDLRGLDPTQQRDVSPFHDRLKQQMHLILTERGLPALLRYEDRNSMTHSVEARTPFLDYRLVELVFSRPASELIEHGRTKVLLRRALGDLLPQIVLERTDKVGFVTPERAWLRGPLGDLAADVFASRAFAERGLVDAPAARRRLDAHRAGQIDAGYELWRVLNLELWARAFIDRAP